MTKFWRLLMASTVLSGLAGLGSAHAGNIAGLPASTDATQAHIVLAQAVAPDDKNKQRQERQQERQQRQDNRQNNKQNTQNSPPPPPASTRSNSNNNNATGNQNNRNQNTGNNNNNRNNQNTGNNNRNNNANTGNPNKPTTTQSPPPPPPVTNTQNNNDNRGNAGNNNRNNSGNVNNNNRNDNNNRNNRGNADNNNRNNQNNQNTGNNNNRNNSGNANNNNRNNPGNATTTTQPTNNVVRSQDNNKPIVSGGAGKGVAVQNSTGKTITNVNDIKTDRTVVKEGNKTIIKEPGGNTIIKEGNKTIIRHDEANRFKVGAVNVTVQKAGADNRTIIVRPGGQKVVTLTDRNGFLLRRSIILPNGREVILINNRPRVGTFFIVLPPPMIRIPRDRYIVAYRDAPPALIYDTLMAPPVDNIDRAYSLDEIRYSPTLRDRMPRIDIDSVTFDSGSWELAPEQIDKLGPIADAMKRGIEQNPQVVFLVEGYTDAVGNDDDNLSLSDRRAEAVAVALTEQFGVPAENLSTQGYGEQDLKVPTDGPEEANRRVTIRNIAPLLNGRVAQGGGQRGEPMPQ